MRTRTLLLVEDEALIALATARRLKPHGFDVRPVYSGTDAIAAVREQADLELVLMDIDLGDDMDGITAAEEILRHVDLPIVFLTSHDEPDLVARVREITRYGYTLKTSNTFVLVESLHMAFELHDTMNRLKDRERNLSALFNNTLQLFMLVDRDGTLIEINGVARRYYRDLMNRDVRPGMSMVDLVYPGHREDFQASLERCLTGEQVHVIRALPIEPEPWFFECNFSPVYGENGLVERVVFTVLDVTRRERAEQRDHLYARLLNQMDQAIIVTRPTGEIVVWNQGAQRVYGWHADEVIGRLITEVTPSDSSREAAEELLGVLSRGESWQGEFELERRDGSRFSAWITDTPLLDADGRLEYIVGVTTERIAASAGRN